ncbi:hypothetical protein HK097_000626, partial [Rhizophlyctis rosea]
MLHPADGSLLKRDFKCFMDLRTLQGSIIRLRIRDNFCLTPTGSTTVKEEYKDSDPPSDDDWVIADIGLNAINEECVLAFFHIGKDPSELACATEFRGETERWSKEDVQHLEEELFQTLKEVADIEGEPKSDGVKEPQADTTNARVVQVLDSKDLNLLFAYPRPRLSNLLRGDVDKVWDMTDLYGTLLPPEDYRRFRDELGRLRERKERGGTKGKPRPVQVASLPDNCTSGLFYMQHRMLTLENYPTSLPPTNDSFENVETVVVPYGAVTFVCMQRRKPLMPATAHAAAASQQVRATNKPDALISSTQPPDSAIALPQHPFPHPHITPTPPTQPRSISDNSFFESEVDGEEFASAKRRRIDEPSVLFSGTPSSHPGLQHPELMDARHRREELHARAPPHPGPEPPAWYHPGAMDPFEPQPVGPHSPRGYPS